MSHFRVDILSPSSVIAKGVEADSIFVPSVVGQLNILKDHTHIVTELSPGVVSLVTVGGKKREFFVTKGVLKVLNNEVTLLVGVGEDAGKIDLNRAKLAEEKATEKLKNTSQLNNDEILKYQRKLERARTRLAIAKNFKA
jgi:F-type H+-transporting ATPase subunit epsilon